jgi:hypothetical protein
MDEQIATPPAYEEPAVEDLPVDGPATVVAINQVSNTPVS